MAIKLNHTIVHSKDKKTAAHSSTPPIYEKEIQDALVLVKKLETSLEP